MSSPLSRVMSGHIFKVPARRQRKPEIIPSDIPTLLGYTAQLTEVKWSRLRARRFKRG